MESARILTFGLVLLLPTAAAYAYPPLHVDSSLKDCEVQFAPELTQRAYGRFVREFGSVSAFKQNSGPTTLGQWGFAFDLQGIYFVVDEDANAWNDTFAHPNAHHPLGSTKIFPELRARLGVLDDLDVGVFYTENPEANYGWIGLEAKYALLEQSEGDSERMPVSVALRGAYTKTVYVSDMDMHALTADATVGRTFWSVFTPYAGLGADLVIADETSKAVKLDTETQLAPHLTAGLDFRVWHVGVGVEAQLATVSHAHLQVSAMF